VGDRPRGRDGGKRGGNRGSASTLRKGVTFTLLVTVAAVVTSVLAVGTAGAVLVATHGTATTQVGPPELATALAGAIAQNPGTVTGASLDEYPPGGNPAAVSTQSLGSFPTNGGSYAILTTGDAALAGTPNESGSDGVSAGGGNVRGNTDYDVTVLRIDLAVPQSANCLTFDFRFLSEEFPEYVGSTVNDAFVAELDESTWTTADSEISAPLNFAFDSQGNVISVNTAGMSALQAAGTTYDGATPVLSASTPITPGAHSLFLSIFDQGDSVYDSAVFVDRLVLGTASPGGCQTGATALSAGIVADGSESPAGGTNGYTITVSNSSSTEATLTSISALLPAGFSYITESTTGAGEPTIEGQTLTWNESFPVPGNGNVSLHFEVLVSSTPGTYTAEASATGEGVSVTPSGPSAPITVTGPSEPADLTAAIAADEAQSAPGTTNGYTITISNPNTGGATLTSISAVLPAGFSYVAESTTGATTGEPTIDGRTLTWSGSFPVAGSGSVSLHFDVVVSSTPGTYTAEAFAGGEGITVTPSGPSAPITVTEPAPLTDLTAAIAADQAESAPGGTNGYTITIGNPNPGQATLTSISAVLPAGFSYVAGSTTGATTANPTADGSTLTWSGSFPVAGDGSTSLHFNVVVSSTPGTYTAEAFASGEGITVTPSGPSAPITVAEPEATGTIESAGPLNLIQISTLLNCDVRHVDDEFPEFFEGTACGTFVAVGETLFGPEDVPAGPNPTPFTPVSQTPATGSGTAADPYRVVTVVDLGQTGLRIEQTDSYVVGDESYRTDVVVRNLGGQSRSVILYRAGDCFLAESDSGFGSADPATGSVACIGVDESGNAPGTRIEQWVPLTPGSTYYEARYSEVWALIEALQPFPSTCRCAEEIDNGAGLSWQLTIPAEGSVTASHLTRFSPTGNQPPAPAPPADQPPPSANLILTLSASAATASVGDPIGFAGNVTNHGPGPAFSVTVVGTVSQTVSLTSVSTGAGPCSVTGNAFTCSIGTLQNGGSATVTVAGTLVSAGAVVATMSVSAEQQDPEQANNSASATIGAPPAAQPGPFLPPVPADLPPPRRGVTVNVTPLLGIVLVNGVRLREGEQIPVGATVDTRRGRVLLQSANGTAAFKEGLFRIVEPRTPGGFTELRLLGGNFLGGCGHPARQLSTADGAETHEKKVVRRLWGNGTGRFRTSGRFSSATVRGTIWLTEDRCDGTRTKVLRGTVAVLDAVLKRKVLVGPGESYLARAPK
jgi:uncharacterized repeat protein (TIGR01451 family)